MSGADPHSDFRDELLFASTLATILGASAFDAASFTSTARSIEAAKSGCPGLLITDVSMPEMNGVELAIRFKMLYPSCRFFSSQDTTRRPNFWKAPKRVETTSLFSQSQSS